MADLAEGGAWRRGSAWIGLEAGPGGGCARLRGMAGAGVEQALQLVHPGSLVSGWLHAQVLQGHAGKTAGCGPGAGLLGSAMVSAGFWSWRVLPSWLRWGWG